MRRGTRPSRSILALVAAGLVACGPGPAAGAELDTTAVAEVDLSISVPLPPPHQGAHASLTTRDDLDRFSRSVAVHSIRTRSHEPGSQHGCVGGTTYLIVVVSSNGQRTTLNATTCADMITSDFTGKDLKGFLADIQAMVP